MTKTQSSEKYILLLIVLIAIFFRVWQLESIPPGLYPDEAINANEALGSIKTKNWQVFYPENNGREGLFIWLISLSFFIFGVSVWSLKIVPALIGVLTVAGLYLFTKELILATGDLKGKSTASYGASRQQATSIALLASFFLAISFWHINFSRIAFRAILVPFILVFSLYFLIKGFSTRKKFHFAIAGLFFGLGFYTYSVFRLSVMLLAIIFILWYLIYKKQNLQKKYLSLVSCFLLLAFVVALPIGVYFLKNPQNFIGRSSQISIFSQENIPKAFFKSLILHFSMFNFYGDGNWRHNLPSSPQLLWPIGILFLIGVFISIKRLISSAKKKNYSLFILHSSLLGWFLVMLLASALTYEGIPHALRSIGVIPVVYIFVSLGGYHLYHWLNSRFGNRKLLLVLCSLFLVLLVIAQFNKYFITWGAHPETKNAFSRDCVQIGNYLNELPADTQKIVVVNRGGVPVPWPDGIPVSAQTIMFIENAKYGKIQSIYLLPESLEKVKIEKRTVIIPLEYDQDLFQKLQIMFPAGEIRKENEISTYQIP